LATDNVTIRLAGKRLRCRAGTSVAVALWEQGIRVLSHSPKYGRPRGLHCARGQCTSCLMRVDGQPNVRTCLTEVRDGMIVERQDSGVPLGGLLQKGLAFGGSLIPVGFYYKWFTRPALLSRLFLKSIRPLAGVGRVPTPQTYRQADLPGAEDLGRRNHLIVGGGLSGLTAAATSAEHSLLVDDHQQPGGQRWAALQTVAAAQGTPVERFAALSRAHRRLEQAVAQIAALSGNESRLGWRVVAAYEPDVVVLSDGQRLATVGCDRLTWAAGALDVTGLFTGNDRPGLLGPRALYRLLCRDGMDVRNRRILVTGGGFDFWLAAAIAHCCGAQVSLVLSEGGWQSEVSTAIDLGWQFNSGLELVSSRYNKRGLRLAFAPVQGDQDHPASYVELGCDLAVVARRGKPVYDLLYQLGADLVHQPELGGYLPAGTRRGHFATELDSGLELEVLGEAAGALPAELLASPTEVTPA